MAHKISCKLIKLKDINNLNDVSAHILTRTCNIPVPLTKKDKENDINLTGDENIYRYSWIDVSGNTKLDRSLHTDIDDDVDDADNIESVTYIKATANIEYPKNVKRHSNGQYLPRSERINTVQITVYFFLKNYYQDTSVYALICSANELQISRVKQLICNQNTRFHDNQPTLPNNFLNWLFYSYSEKEGRLDNHVKLKEIGGFIGNISDEHNIFGGTSDQTSELIITKAFISNGETLKNMTTRMSNEDINVTFSISNTLETIVYSNLSTKKMLLDSENDTTFFILYLYGFLIPDIIKIYSNNNDSFLSSDRLLFSKKIGMHVINSIIRKNNIPIEDINDIYSNIDFSTF